MYPEGNLLKAVCIMYQRPWIPFTCVGMPVAMAKHPELPEALQKELRETADAIVRDGHGLLAADESIGSMEKRFVKIGQLGGGGWYIKQEL